MFLRHLINRARLPCRDFISCPLSSAHGLCPLLLKALRRFLSFVIVYYRKVRKQRCGKIKEILLRDVCLRGSKAGILMVPFGLGTQGAKCMCVHARVP